jgi:dipeptidyl aminopeptidase/acylaminoacyl peptidase
LIPTGESQVVTMPVSPRPGVTNSPPPTALSELEQYTIEALRGRAYGGGKIEIVQTQVEVEAFTRYQIHYPSDDLTIYGFINVPKGPGPYPVIIAVHGYAERDIYLADYETGIFDVLASAGYIVVFPFLRTYAPSDNGDN